MTPPLTLQPDHPLEPTAAAETTSTQLFGVLYITLTGLVDSMVPNSGPWSLLGQSVPYIIKLAPILWWALPAGLAVPHPKLPKAPTYNWLPDMGGFMLSSEEKARCVAQGLCLYCSLAGHIVMNSSPTRPNPFKPPSNPQPLMAAEEGGNKANTSLYSTAPTTLAFNTQKVHTTTLLETRTMGNFIDHLLVKSLGKQATPVLQLNQ
ncbi:hypothetical protein DSO57_1007202 [Entomophthora muscae]|uniref:Uncharacterized protein n=1 Tax=Entomophthora muscae TaxID=34485 RepID=A0ACC2TI98_9FUNG|nr:hypothetical protein DSO57_1007202 [Entomophthora muscae]